MRWVSCMTAASTAFSTLGASAHAEALTSPVSTSTVRKDKTVTDTFYVRAGVRSNMFESGDVIDDAGGVTYSLGVGWYY